MRLRSLLPVLALASTGLTARADIITALASAPTQVAGGWAYTYNVSLQGGQLDSTSDTSTPQFGTVYDFGPVLTNSNGTLYTATGLLATSFAFSFDPTDPAAFLTVPTDDPSLDNVRFTYTGTTNYVESGVTTTLPVYTTLASSPSNLGTFTVLSAYGPPLRTTLTYDGQSFKGTNNTQQGNVGLTSGPSLAVTPEPSTFALLGTGLLGIAGAVRRRQLA